MSAMSDDLDDSAGSPLLSPSLSVSREQDSPDRNPSSGRKRAAMPTSEEEPPKRQAISGADAGQDVMFRVLCPANRVGSVIGKGGAVIEQIRKESRAKIQVVESRGDAVFRVIIISSPAATGVEWSPAQEALFSIHRRIVEGDPSDEMDVAATVLRLLVPGSQIGCLLGKGGAVISKLREESGAGIKVMGGDQLPRCAHPSDEMVMVGNTPLDGPLP